MDGLGFQSPADPERASGAPGVPPRGGPTASPPPAGSWGALRYVGPGLVVAATGVGAGDVVAGAVSGSRFGFAVLWAAAAGAILKYVLNEGLARWQIATGTTLIEGWANRLGGWTRYWFLSYLIVWSFVVGGALISACGLAAHAVAPALPVGAWGVIHSLAGAAIVLLGGYAPFERVMKWFTALMFVCLVGCAAAVAPPAVSLARGVAEAALPPGGVGLVLGVIGGVGGSVTLLSYSYWIREKGWEGPEWRRVVRVDLGVAYALTGIFGVAIVVLSAQVLQPTGVPVRGNAAVLRMADMMGTLLGPAGTWVFLTGFWAAVSTSLLGVWQGVPYIFCDFVGLMKRLPEEKRREIVGTRSRWYRGFLLYLAGPPLALLLVREPIFVIVTYAAAGALFMPFLAGTLLYMNSRARWVGAGLRNGWLTNLLLMLCLLLFAWLGVTEVLEAVRRSG